MGVPHLITFLRPFATIHSLKDKETVIDGPALAYHIHHVCLGTRKSAGNYFEAAPSYKQLGDSVLAWLDGLEKAGATVRRIYFDGYLPTGKFDVRLERLGRNTKQLHDYYNQYPDGLRYKPSSTTAVQDPAFPFGFVSPRPNLAKLPAISFLVPAILETLRISDKYKDIVEIVPGEADTYCAGYLRQYGGVVFTGDSDLLVHDLGESGSVCFFKDIELSPESGHWALQSHIYYAASIVERLCLPQTPGLRALAFEIRMDSHSSFRKLLAQATTSSAIRQYKDMYENFVKEYLPVPVDTTVLTLTQSGVSSMRSALQLLDTRVCEYVLQFSHIICELGQLHEDSKTTETINIYLPFLIDCPTRTNAWEISTSVRQLAYGCINVMVPPELQTSTVFEHRRQPKTSRGRELQIPLSTDLVDLCTVILSLLDRVSRSKLTEPTSPSFWGFVAILQDAEWSSSVGKLGLSRQILSKPHSKQKGSPRSSEIITWDQIQFVAQIQGSYYSFRMLKQILNFVIATKGSSILPKPLLELYGRLQSLPDLNHITGVGDLHIMMEKMQSMDILGSLLDDKVVLERSSSGTTEKSSKQSKKKRKRGQASGSVEKRGKSSNPFDILGMEEDHSD